MIRSLWKPPSPAIRSAQDTLPDAPAHSTPTSARSQSSTGSAPAGLCNSRRTIATSRVGTSTPSQATMRICEIEVDHGSVITTATASQSASRSSAARSKARPIRLGFTASAIVSYPRRSATFWRLRVKTV
jgi:hypothetical protein